MEGRPSPLCSRTPDAAGVDNFQNPRGCFSYFVYRRTKLYYEGFALIWGVLWKWGGACATPKPAIFHAYAVQQLGWQCQGSGTGKCIISLRGKSFTPALRLLYCLQGYRAGKTTQTRYRSQTATRNELPTCKPPDLEIQQSTRMENSSRM